MLRLFIAPQNAFTKVYRRGRCLFRNIRHFLTRIIEHVVLMAHHHTADVCPFR